MAAKTLTEHTLAKDHNVRKKNIVLNKPTLHARMWKPHEPKDIQQLADELLQWCKLDSSTDITDFPLSKNINPYYFNHISDEYFQDVLCAAKYALNSRNKKLVNLRKYEKELLFKYLRLMDRDFKEDYDDQIAKRVAGSKQSLGDITIVDHMLGEKE